jgi:hypothetical protein
MFCRITTAHKVIELDTKATKVWRTADRRTHERRLKMGMSSETDSQAQMPPRLDSIEGGASATSTPAPTPAGAELRQIVANDDNSGAPSVTTKRATKAEKAAKEAAKKTAEKEARSELERLKTIGKSFIDQAAQYRKNNKALRNELIGAVTALVKAPGFDAAAFYKANALKKTKHPAVGIFQNAVDGLDRKLPANWAAAADWIVKTTGHADDVQTWLDGHSLKEALDGARAEKRPAAATSDVSPPRAKPIFVRLPEQPSEGESLTIRFVGGKWTSELAEGVAAHAQAAESEMPTAHPSPADGVVPEGSETVLEAEQAAA